MGIEQAKKCCLCDKNNNDNVDERMDFLGPKDHNLRPIFNP